MFKSKKTVQKSIRMTNEVYNFVEAFEGEGFNEKFENLVLFCLREEKEIKKSLQTQKKTHEANEKRIELQRKVLSDLENISCSVKSLLDMAKKSEISVKGVQLKMIESEQCEEVPKAKNVTQKQSSGSSPRGRNELQKDDNINEEKENVFFKCCFDCEYCVKKDNAYWCIEDEDDEMQMIMNDDMFYYQECEGRKPLKAVV